MSERVSATSSARRSLVMVSGMVLSFAMVWNSAMAVADRVCSASTDRTDSTSVRELLGRATRDTSTRSAAMMLLP